MRLQQGGLVSMYRWRRMTDEERRAVLAKRRFNGRSWHRPTHRGDVNGAFLLTAACYEHRPIIGHSIARMTEMSEALLECCERADDRVSVRVVLPNHYHIVANVGDVRQWIHQLSQLHGRTSYRWNGEEAQRGRKVWHRCAETAMKSNRHLQATILYVLHNAVRHGYVDHWQDWPFCNAREWLDATGRDRARALWNAHPLGDYGRDWDPSEL